MPHRFLGNSSNIYDASSYWQRSMACRSRSRITEIVVGLIILTFGVSTNQGVAPIRKADTASAASAFSILCSSIYPDRTPNYTARIRSFITIRNHSLLIACSLLGGWGHSAKWSNPYNRKLRGIRVDASELYYWLYLFGDKGSRSTHNAISGSVPPEGSYLLLKRKTGILFIQMCCSLHTHFWGCK